MIVIFLSFSNITSNIWENNSSNSTQIINKNSSSTNSSQYLSLEEVSKNTNVMTNDVDITTTLSLPDNKIFFGGEDGYWSVQTIINNEVFGDTLSGRVGKYESLNISASIMTDDYDSSSKILLGFSNGFIGTLNLEDSEFEFFNTDLITNNINHFVSLGNGEYDVYQLGNPDVIKTNINTKESVNDGKIDFGELSDTSRTNVFLDSPDNKVFSGNNSGDLFLYDPSNDTTILVYKIEPHGDVPSLISTLTLIDSSHIFVGTIYGNWVNIDFSAVDSDTKGKKTSEGVWDAKGNFSIQTSIVIPNTNNSEVLASGETGKWTIIDITSDSPGNVSDGVFPGRKDVNLFSNTSVNDDEFTGLFSMRDGVWISIKIIGKNSGFNKDVSPEQVLSDGDSISYKITIKNDYPDWPKDVMKYRIRSTITDSTNGVDITSLSDTYSSSGEIQVDMINLFSPNLTYNNLKIQMTKEDGETLEGDEWDTGVSLTTSLGKVKNINSSTLHEVRSDGFDFTIDSFSTSSSDPSNIETYKINVSAQKIDGVEKETVIWTSEELSSAIDGTDYTVTGLQSGVSYEGVNIQATYNDVGVGVPLELSSKIETSNIPTNLTTEIGEKTSTSFEVVANIEAENLEKGIINNSGNGYYMHVNDNNGKLDFVSEESHQSGTNVIFLIDNLPIGESYEEINVFLSWDKEGEDKIENCSTTLGDVTIENHIKRITSAKINDPTTEDSITIDVEVEAETKEKSTSIPYIIQVFDTYTSLENPIYETEEYTQSSGEIKIIVPDLSPKTLYHFKLQLAEGPEKTKIGRMFDVPEQATISSLVTGIGDIKVSAIETHSFKVNIEINSENDEIEVEKYGLEFFANGEEEKPVWKKEYSEAGIKEIVIDGLSLSTEYKDTSFQLYDLSTEEKIGDSKKGPNITTLGRITGLNDSVKPTATNIKQKGFDMSFNVKDTFLDEKSHSVEKYWILIYANGDHENPIWAPKDGYDYSGLVSLKITGLKSYTKFSNIEIQFVDKDGFAMLGNPLETGINVKTKFNQAILIGGISGVVLLLILIIITSITVVIMLRRKSENDRERSQQNLRSF